MAEQPIYTGLPGLLLLPIAGVGGVVVAGHNSRLVYWSLFLLLSLFVFLLATYAFPGTSTALIDVNTTYHEESLIPFLKDAKVPQHKMLYVDAANSRVIQAIAATGSTPGSHHSYSYKGPTGVVPGSSFISALFDNHISRPTVVGLARTQYRTLAEQLGDGVRYLDLRLSLVDGEVVVDHGGVIFGTFQEFLVDLEKALTFLPGDASLRVGLRSSSGTESREDIFQSIDALQRRVSAVSPDFGTYEADRCVFEWGSHATTSYLRTATDADAVNALALSDEKPYTALILTIGADVLALSVALNFLLSARATGVVVALVSSVRRRSAFIEEAMRRRVGDAEKYFPGDYKEESELRGPIEEEKI